ncbi:MAG: hypothetical protein JOZ15_01530 [Acidobacteria bacterium]|nr:hypothetical protein [Acidobacteriota bacterium]
MKGAWRGWLLAVLQLSLVASLAGKYLLDRHTLPHGWVRARPYDPQLPVRGRYVRLRVETRLDNALRTAEAERAGAHDRNWWSGSAHLAMDRDGLILKPDANGKQLWIQAVGGRFYLEEPVAFFIPEKVPDPSLRPPGEELWVDVSLPRHGPPRPIRLGVLRGGVLTPLHLD